MTEQNPIVAAITDYPLVISPAVGLPGEIITVAANDGPRIKEGWESARDRIFVAPIGFKKGDIGMIGVVQKHDSANGKMEIEIQIEARGRVHDVKSDGISYASVEKVLPSMPANAVPATFIMFAQETVAKFASVFAAELQRNSKLLDELNNFASTQPWLVADIIAGEMKLSPDRKKEYLKIVDAGAQLDLVQLNLLDKEMEAWGRAQDKKYGRKNSAAADDDEDFDLLAQKIAETGMSEEARTECEKELKKLRKMSQQDPNLSKTQERIEKIIALPWARFSPTEPSLQTVQEKLDAGHFGLDNVKDRIVEDVAVQLQTGKPSGAIICLTGEPGVGKTSIAMGIGEATGREVVVVKLGGVSDEADIRGFIPTYVGAIEGRIMKAIAKAKTMNPIIVLDEIDKMGSDNGRGDPTAALLELLDPAQNHAFVDRYMGIEFDMSNVLFLATANYPEKIPAPLFDRMEVIPLKGYSDEGKMQIAKDYLIPKQLEKSGLTADEFSITDAGLKSVIDGYTYEAGVRSLEKMIAKLARKEVVQIQKGNTEPLEITPDNLEQYAGPKKIERELVKPEPRVGHINGLAVTGSTGSVLEIEAARFDKAYSPVGLAATGNLEQTIAESVEYADACIMSKARELGIPPEEYQDFGMHIKVAKGGISKDGPSAGLAIATLIASVRTGIPIRGDVAMTGEISVLGESGPIGGLDHKLDGAFKSGIKTVLIPAANLKDFDDLDFPPKLKENLEIVTDANAKNLGNVPEGKMRVIAVKNIEEVLKHALVEMPKPLPKVEETLQDACAAQADTTDADADIDTYIRDRIRGELRSLFKEAVAAELGHPPANDDEVPVVAKRARTVKPGPQ